MGMANGHGRPLAKHEPTRGGVFADWSCWWLPGDHHTLGLRSDGCFCLAERRNPAVGSGRHRGSPCSDPVPSPVPPLPGPRTLRSVPGDRWGGTVNGNGIDCAWNGAGSSGACSVNLTANTPVTLSASPSPGSSFDGWIGGSGSAAGCSGSGNCTFTITALSWVGSPFTLTSQAFLLTVSPSGTGSGTVTGNGINAPGTAPAAAAPTRNLAGIRR